MATPLIWICLSQHSTAYSEIAILPRDMMIHGLVWRVPDSWTNL